MALDTLNNKLFLAGRFTSVPTTFGSESNAITLTSSKASFDAFVAHLDIDGNLKWVTAPTGNWQGETWASGVSSDQKGNCFAAGHFGGAGATDFGSTHFEDISPARIFVSKISDPGVIYTTTNQALSQSFFSVYPNPGNILNISYKNNAPINILKLEIKNTMGQIIFSSTSYSINGEYKTTIDLSHQSKGIYFIEVISDGRRSVKKIILN